MDFFKEQVVGIFIPTRVHTLSISNKMSSRQTVSCFLECVFHP